MTRPEILEAARVCVCGEREHDYGTPEDNFTTIGLLWGVYLNAAHPEYTKAFPFNGITAKDVATMSTASKQPAAPPSSASVDIPAKPRSRNGSGVFPCSKV